MATLEFVFGFIKVSAISTCSLEVAYFCKAALSNTSIESIMSCVLVGSVLYITSALTTSSIFSHSASKLVFISGV